MKKLNNSKSIEEIIEHRHTKALVVCLVIVGLIMYIANYKKIEAFPHSTYLYNVVIGSDNADDKSVAVAGDTVTLSFQVYDTQVLDNLTVSINNKSAIIACNYIGAPLTFNFIEKVHAQYYDPSECKATIIMTAEEIESTANIVTFLPFEVKFTQNISSDDPVSLVNFAAINTDDGSFVMVKRPSKTSDYVSNINIQSTTFTDTTLASAESKINVTYYINDYYSVSDHKASILDKEAKIMCEPAKENIPVVSTEIATATPQSGVKVPRVITDTEILDVVKSEVTPLQIPTRLPEQSPVTVDILNDKVEQPIEALDKLKENINQESQLKKSVLEEVLLNLIPEKVSELLGYLLTSTVYAKAAENTLKLEKSFSGPAKCVASIDVTKLDLENAIYNLVPFTIDMTISTRIDKTEIKIDKVTNSSFVRIVKDIPLTVSMPAPGVVFPVSIIVTPQDSAIKIGNKDIIGKKCIPIKGFYKIGDVNEEIKNIRESINQAMGTNLPINNKFDRELFVALKTWQEKYRDTVLDPWSVNKPSGYFYKTSNWSMNYQNGCEVPKFVLEKYKISQ